jgi:hypothetical protein
MRRATAVPSAALRGALVSRCVSRVCKSGIVMQYVRNHWSTHKNDCKRRKAELRDEALFKDPPAMEDCPICFLPMPVNIFSCASFPPATLSSVPVHDFAIANEGLEDKHMEQYLPCCGKNICRGCFHSSASTRLVLGLGLQCPFCNSDHSNKTDEEIVEETMKRVAVNDAGAICIMASYHYYGLKGVQQDQDRAVELYTRAADLGLNKMAHFCLGMHYDEVGDIKKTKFHYEAAAMAGHEMARNNIGTLEYNSGNIERAVKHWKIAASTADHRAMHELRTLFEEGLVSRDAIDSTLTAYNNSCAEMRSEARDKYLRIILRMNESTNNN